MNLSEAVPFLEKLLPEIRASGVDVTSYVCDHICYRVADQTTYEAEKKALDHLGTLLVESEVGGRPIATYKLKEPIRGAGLEISVVELPAPKPNKPMPNGFEHIEFATGFHPEKFIKMYPHLEFKTTGLSKSFNAEIELKLQSGSVKFHELPLERVIEIELADS